MRVDHHSTLSRQASNLLQQLSRATDRKPRREAITNPALSATVPLLEQRDRLIDGLGSLFAQSEWHFIAFVHHALADCRPESRLFDNFENFAGMVDSLQDRKSTRLNSSHLLISHAV